MMFSFSENIRRKAFWVIDFVNKSPINKNYKEIKFINEHYNTIEASNKIQSNLKSILDHAVRTTVFYSQLKPHSSLSDFPVINKNIIRERPSDFISGIFKKSSLFKVTTSGSTGTPFSIFQDKQKRNRHTADNIYFNKLAGLDIGNRLYYFRIWNSLIQRARLRNFIQNIIVLNASLLTEEVFNNFFAKISSDHSSKNILAYASTLEAMGHHLERHPNITNISKVNSIISMSETLPEGTRQQLKHFFSCPVISRYSNMENGFIAQQCAQDSQEYHINSASFYVEILDVNYDKPIETGKMGRIVITDFFNYGMPLIRYDTGDIGIWNVSSNCGINTPVLSSVEGRRVDFILDTSGNLLSPHVITNTMWKFSDIHQFQFIQVSKNKYLMKLNIRSNPPYLRESEMIVELKKYLGANALLNFEYTDEIPLLASGKRKKVMNLMG